MSYTFQSEPFPISCLSQVDNIPIAPKQRIAMGFGPFVGGSDKLVLARSMAIGVWDIGLHTFADLTELRDNILEDWR